MAGADVASRHTVASTVRREIVRHGRKRLGVEGCGLTMEAEQTFPVVHAVSSARGCRSRELDLILGRARGCCDGPLPP